MKTFSLLILCLPLLVFGQTKLSQNEIKERYFRIRKYIQDPKVDTIHFNNWRNELSLVDSFNYYYFKFNRKGLPTSANIIDKKNKYKIELEFDSVGNKYTETHYIRTDVSKDFTRGIHYEYYSNGKIFLECETPLDSPTLIIYFYRKDDGTLVAKRNYWMKDRFYKEHMPLKGISELYYRSGKLKTRIIFHNDKYESVDEFEENGEKITETFVHNGNGRWVGSAIDDSSKYFIYILKKGKIVSAKEDEDKRPY